MYIPISTDKDKGRHTGSDIKREKWKNNVAAEEREAAGKSGGGSKGGGGERESGRVVSKKKEKERKAKGEIKGGRFSSE